MCNVELLWPYFRNKPQHQQQQQLHQIYDLNLAANLVEKHPEARESHEAGKTKLCASLFVD